MDESWFVPSGLEEKEIRLADGSKHILHFAHLSNTAFETYAMQVNSADPEVAGAAAARLLSEGLCNPDGSRALSFERASLLKRPIFRAMFHALLEVNTYDSQKVAAVGKALKPEASAGSGTRSRSRSAAARSRSGKPG